MIISKQFYVIFYLLKCQNFYKFLYLKMYLKIVIAIIWALQVIIINEILQINSSFEPNLLATPSNIKKTY